MACAKYENTFKATFIANGAEIRNGSSYTTSSVTKECSGQTGCNVTAPNIRRAGFNIRGWSTSSGAITASKKTGDSITLSGNVTYYAITDKTVTGTFVKGAGVASVSKTSDTCVIRNTAENCSIEMATATCSAGYENPEWSPTLLNNITNNVTATATCKQIQQADLKCGSKFLSCENGSLVKFTDESKNYKKFNPEDLRKEYGDYFTNGSILNENGFGHECTEDYKCTFLDAVWACQNDSKTIYCKGCNTKLARMYNKKIIEVTDGYGDIPIDSESEGLSCNLDYEIKYIPMSCTFSKKENGSTYIQLRMLDEGGNRQKQIERYYDNIEHLKNYGEPPAFRISFGENSCEEPVFFTTTASDLSLNINTHGYGNGSYICEQSPQDWKGNRIYFKNENIFKDRSIIIKDLHDSLYYQDGSGFLHGNEFIWENIPSEYGYLSNYIGNKFGILWWLSDRTELQDNHQLRFSTKYVNINDPHIHKVLYIYSLPQLCEELNE